MTIGTLIVYAIGVPVLAIVAELPAAVAIEVGAIVFAAVGPRQGRPGGAAAPAGVARGRRTGLTRPASG